MTGSKDLLLFAILFSSLIDLTSAHGQQIKTDEPAIAIGRNVADSTITIGIPAAQLDALVRERTRPIEDLTAAQRETIALLRAKLALNERQIRAALDAIGATNIPPEQLAPKLAEIAARYKSLQAGVVSTSPEDPKVISLKQEARKAIDGGELTRADEVLASVEKIQLASAAGRTNPDAAETRGQRGQVAAVRLQYWHAAQYFADAAGLLPSGLDHSKERLAYLNSEASAYYRRGDEFSDNEALQFAVERYTSIVEMISRDTSPLDWATAQNGLGGALARLGDLQNRTDFLQDSIASFQKALEERTQSKAPLAWAETQRSQGVALTKLGELEKRNDHLERAIASHRQALKVVTRKQHPREWAAIQNNLGVALRTLGQRERDREHLNQAVVAFQEALGEGTRDQAPLVWAKTQANLGSALRSLGELENGTSKLEESASAYHEALTELTRERAPFEWTEARTNLTDVRAMIRERNAEMQVAAAMTFVEKWWKWALSILTGLLLLVNIVILMRARWSPAAWRIATDDSWTTAILRIPALTLRHWGKAQLWILDLYIQKQRGDLDAYPQPYLPVPISGPNREQHQSDHLIAELGPGSRIWVQGGSGMGKTALIRSLSETYFRSVTSAFAAYREHGFILVPIEARRFAEAENDDKRDPAWLIGCIRAVLSTTGLTLENDALLRAILHKGILAIAVDGLNEVARVRSVEAFADAFEKTPILITSHDQGGDRFETWRLPAAIREYLEDLICIYLGDAGKLVFARIEACGLGAHLRSGYDVRLVADLARGDPQNAPLPGDRLSLYSRVVEAAWPRAGEGQRGTHQAQLEAAAWKLVSEREPYEDKRRLSPDTDLPRQLLTDLAEAPESDGRSVRLVRSIGPDFEFVHDQMNMYLAARWCAGRSRSIAEIRQMLSTSKVWKDTREAQHSLWEFFVRMLGSEEIQILWGEIHDDEPWDTLRRALERIANEQEIELKIKRKQRAKVLA